MIAQIRPAQLADWLQQACNAAPGTTPLVLDVREPHEVQIAGVKADGFELRCIPMGSIVQRLAELDPEQPVACLCHHGGRSMQVAQFLASRGFDRVANIAGGIDAWAVELDHHIARY